jgi:hypothetical protein
VTCAPAASAAGGATWARKPHNYCAGLPLPLATLAVNLATGAHPGARRAPLLPASKAPLPPFLRAGLAPAGATVVDPCCGSGTVLFAAACAGASAVAGVEREAALVAQCVANLAATHDAATAARRQLAAGGARALRGGAVCDEAAADAALMGAARAPPPRVLCADSGRVRFAAAGAAVALNVAAEPAEGLSAGGPSRGAQEGPPVTAFVSNLPYGRVVGVAATSAPHLAMAALAPLLAWLRPQAARHAYFAGEPLAPTLRALGFADVAEVCVDPTGRRFLATAASGEAAHARAEAADAADASC